MYKAADTLVDVENAKSLTYYAAWTIDEGLAEAPLAVSMAETYTSDAYREVAGAGIQLHGGIGFTWEHDAHLYQKNAMSQHALFGGPGEQLDRLTALLATRE